MRLSLSFPSRPKLSFLPKENKFFFLLHQSAMNIQKTAGRLQNLLDEFENVPAKVQEIKDLEDFGDRIIHDITRSLHRTFVTPIDREDIMALAGRLDDVVDAMDEAAHYILEYSIEEPTEHARHLTTIIVQCGEELEKAMAAIPTMASSAIAPIPPTIATLRLPALVWLWYSAGSGRSSSESVGELEP